MQSSFISPFLCRAHRPCASLRCSKQSTAHLEAGDLGLIVVYVIILKLKYLPLSHDLLRVSSFLQLCFCGSDIPGKANDMPFLLQNASFVSIQSLSFPLSKKNFFQPNTAS